MSAASKVDEKGNEKVLCEMCSRKGTPLFFHALSVHLASAHRMNVEAYQAEFPGAPTISPYASANIRKAQSMARRPRPVAADLPPDGDGKDGTWLAFGVARLRVRDDVAEDARPFIPVHDDNFELDDDKLESAALAVQFTENIMAVGPTGCGKSAFFIELASIVNQPVRRLNLHGDVRAADFVGEKVVDVDVASGQAIVVWRDGILPDAMRKGYWLLLDELDAAPPAILFVLQAVLEEGRRLVLSANHGEVVEAHPNFRVIATANTLGKGDETGMYTGTQVLNEAFLDRFATVIEWDYPNPATERKILEAKTGIDPTLAAQMVEVAKMVRSGYDKEECFCTFSLRRLLRWAAKTVALKSHSRAAKLTVLNKLSADDRRYVGDVIQRVMGK